MGVILEGLPRSGARKQKIGERAAAVTYFDVGLFGIRDAKGQEQGTVYTRHQGKTKALVELIQKVSTKAREQCGAIRDPREQ